MAELKTKKNKGSVAEFLKSIDDRQQLADCRVIAGIMRKATGKRAAMWGTAIVGFGSYDYTYASGASGTWPVTGFSPRARNISIYVMPGFSNYQSLLGKLGKHKTGKSCLYIRRLEDVDLACLEQLITESVREMRQRYPSQT